VSSLGSLVALAGASLAVIAAFVFGLHDSTLFVSPPEARTEAFVRSVQTHRYAQARQYLSDTLRSRVSAADLEQFRNEITARFGEVENVSAERRNIDGDRAEADAILQLRGNGYARLSVALVRNAGTWKLNSLPEFR
jgi:hypothetical protein